MAEEFLGSPTGKSMGLGLRVPGSPVAGDPATRMGLGGMQSTAADNLVGLGGYTPGAYAMESATRLQAPQAPARAYFNQATNEMFVGDKSFAATDVRSALETAQAPTTVAPQGGGWVALPESSYNRYLTSLSERRGGTELLGLGTRQVAEGVIGGTGALLEMAGAEDVGGAIRGFATGMFGQDENEQLRSALIAENSTLMERIIDGAWQAVPTVAASLTGAGAVGLGVRAAGGGALAVQGGATAGGAAINFPMHVNSFYEAALRNGFDPNNPEVKTEILGGAITNTALDMFGVNALAGKVLSRAAREAAEEAGKQAARGALRNAATGVVRTGFAEAVTEASQTFLESVLFDTTVRASLTASDWTALGPYIAKTYGDDILVAAGAGAILGGGLGGAMNFRSTGQLTTDPTNLGDVAGNQAATKEAEATTPQLPQAPQLSPPPGPGAAELEANALERSWRNLPDEFGNAPLRSALSPEEAALADQWQQQTSMGTLQLTPAMQGTPAAATPGGRLLLTQGMRVRDEEAAAGRQPPLPLTPDMQVPPGQLMLTQGMRVRGEEAASGRPATLPLTQDMRARGEEVAAGRLPTLPLTQEMQVRPIEEVVVPPRKPLTKKEKAAAKKAAEVPPPPAVATMSPPATSVTSTAARGIESGMAALAEGGRKAGRQRVADLIAQNKPVTYRNPSAVAAAKADPDQTTVDNPDGSVTVTGIRVEPSAPWVGTPPAAPAAPKSDVVSETVVGPEGLTLVHGGKPGLTLDSVQIVRSAGQMKQGKKGRVYGGFYATSEAEAEQATGYAGEGGAVYDVRVAPGTRVAQRGGDITRLSKQTIDQYVADGYGVVYGTDPRGRTEFVVVDKAVIESVTPRATPEPTPPTGPGKGTKAATVRKGAEAGPKGTKVATVRKGEAAPKPRAEAAPAVRAVVTPRSMLSPRQQDALAEQEAARLDEVDAGTRARTPRLSPEEVAARREAERTAPTAAQMRTPVTREEAVRRAEAEGAVVAAGQVETELTPNQLEAQRLNEELDQYIEDLDSANEGGVASERDAALFGIATVANGRTPRGLGDANKELADAYRARLQRAKVHLASLPQADQDYAAELYRKYGKLGSVPEMSGAGEAMTEAVGGADPIHTLNTMLDVFAAHRSSGDALPPGFMAAFKETALAVKALGEQGRAALRGNSQLLAFVNAQNEPNVQRGELTPRAGGFSLANWNTIEGVVDLDGKPVTAVAPGRVELLVRGFLGKLARAPRVTVARNQADLKARFPQLYARAVAARPQGDFDAAQAMGYSFGDGQVIIFTDRIATEQQLRFVLAHETLGHFGLRGIMPGPKFDALMETLYAGSPSVRAAADAAMDANPKLSRAEAVEEYLSDYAAVLETSMVARVWNAIKGVLNTLGIRTGDEMTRYILDQARRYARYGSGVTFDAQSVGQRLHDVETTGDTGRFSLGPKMRDVNLSAALQMDSIGGRPMNFQEAWQDLKRQGVNSVESWDKFKATFLSLANFRSRQNPGLMALEKLLDEARNLSMATKVEFNERLALVLNRAIAGEVGGISDAQTAKINEMLYAAQRFNVAQVQGMGDLGNAPMFRSVDGKLEVDPDVLGPLQRLGTRTFAQMRDGFEFEISYQEAGKTVTKTEKFPGIKGLTEKSIEWRGYQKIRQAMDEIELRLLKARYEGAMKERDLAFRQIAATVPDGELSADERAALTTLAQTYGDLYTSNIQQDESGRAVLDADYQTYANDILRTANAALIGKAGDRFDALRKLLTEPRQFVKGETTDVRRELPAIMEAQAADDLVARLQGFKSRMRITDDRFVVQNKVKQVILAELASKDADKFTKRTIATGYTPVLREGAYQMRVEAFVGGRVVRLQDSYREQLVYSQFENAGQAMEMVDKTNALFKGNKFEAMYYDSVAGEYVLGQVELRAVSEAALDAVAAPPQLNLNEFIRGLRQFDIALSPEKMEDVIVALTKQNSAARNRLERVFTPGADMDGIMATMRHIESRASTISKVIVRPQLAELMDRSMSSTMALWNGDPEHLAKLKKRAEDAAKDTTLSREAKADAQREYEQYAYMYNQTNPGGGKPRKGNQFYSEAANTVAFLDGNKNVDESDFGSGPMVSRIRAATSMMQLGGSVATGALNILSVYTNGVPYLSSYNSKTAFGGGFSVGKVMVELHRAGAQVGAPGVTSGQMNTAEFYDKVARNPELQKRYKLKAHEAAFISREILDGAMIPAQSNALVGTARGRTTKGWQQQFLDKWMWTFNVTEQASRRTLGLTAYRLEFARQVAAGKSEADASATARQFAVQALQFTMGEYSVLNRPPAWRSGIQSFMYMYKVFPTTSVQMFMNLSRNGKYGMLIGLWTLTGLAGLPFAEDLEDAIDTLAQKLKVSGWQGARYEAAQFIDGIFPGMSPMFLKGIVNDVIPADVASRTSLGNLLPGTDVLLAGTDVSRGLGEIAGPAPSMLLGTAKFVADAIALPFSTTTTLEGVAREAPVTMVRALGDAYAYTQSGAVVDRRGYVVAPDMSVGTIITRALGFYPAAAANQYDMIRAAKRMTDYQRETVTGFRTAWVSAMMRGDRDFARQIEDAVDDWNMGADGTALEIRNFVAGSRRALKEAKRPALDRTLRSAPDAAAKDLQRMVDLMTLN